MTIWGSLLRWPYFKGVFQNKMYYPANISNVAFEQVNVDGVGINQTQSLSRGVTRIPSNI